ncbi:MAG: hypothetical protein EB034_17270, partial [Verrucomicrobia bacterium]|nr:hypothetical protein [Verrucomicrobiota bacterium]
VPQDRYPFKLHIIEDASLNAFALPGGNVAIHSGLLLTADSPEEVLGVLGHELSHVTKQHGLRGIVQSLGLYAVVTTFFGDVSGLAAILVNNAPFPRRVNAARARENRSSPHPLHFASCLRPCTSTARPMSSITVELT